MNVMDETASDFERRAQRVLEASLTRIDGRTRSRLNRARQAALEQATSSGGALRWRMGFMPAAGAVAVTLLMAVVLWHRVLPAAGPGTAGQRPAVEDMALLADGEALDLIEGGDGDGLFYEWAAGQTDANAAGQG
ncbi:MAG: hypothetical protein JSR67_08260 [Proteobacteria bacterium]|nr:hypothetical protein [Pseudomonadota bacterium]